MGGGIYVSSGTLEVTENSVIKNNTVTESSGGNSIFSTVNGTVIIDENTITGEVYTLDENYNPSETE